MAEQKFTLDDLQNTKVEEILKPLAYADCRAFQGVLNNHAQELEKKGFTRIAFAVRRLSAVCSMHFRPEAPGEPFGAELELGDQRTLIPIDLIGEQSKALSEFASRIREPALRARLADVAWLNDRSNSASARTAISAYFDIVDGVLDETLTHEFDRDSALDYRTVDLLRRGLQIERLIRKTKSWSVRARTTVDRCVAVAIEAGELPALVRLGRLALQLPVLSPSQVVKIIEPKIARSNDHQWMKSAYEVLAEAHKRRGAKEKQNAALRQIAEQSVLIGDAMSSSAMAQAHWLMVAISELARVPGSRARQKELRARLRDVQEDSLNEMGAFSTPLDVAHMRSSAKSALEGLSLGQALGEFSTYYVSARPEDLRDQAIEHARNFPLQSTFAASRLDS